MNKIESEIINMLQDAKVFYTSIESQEDFNPRATQWAAEFDAAYILYKNENIKQHEIAPLLKGHAENLDEAGFPFQARRYRDLAKALRQ